MFRKKYSLNLFPVTFCVSTFFLLFWTLFLGSDLQAQTIYTTINNGSYTSSSTWQGGNKPSKNLGNNKHVFIHHNVTLNDDLKIDGNSNTKVVVDGGSFDCNKGLEIKKGSFQAINSEIEFTDNVKADGSNTSIELENSCFIITNGNFDIVDGDGTFNQACIKVNNGNFKSDGGDISGTGVSAFWVRNGNLEKSGGSWSAYVSNYRVSGSNQVPNSYKGSSQNNSWMTSYFNTCQCIPPPCNLTVSCSSTDVSCNGGSDGSATVSSTGGIGTVTYSWSNGGSGSTNLNLSVGSYSVLATDANGCTASCSVNISQPGALTVSCSGTDVSCNGGSDGSATVSSTGGTGTVTYSWSNGGSGSTNSNISAGSYTVVATDANGCTASCSATVNEPSPLTLTLVGTTDPSAASASDGEIRVSSSGGVAAGADNLCIVGGIYTSPGLCESAGTYDFNSTNGYTLASGTYTITGNFLANGAGVPAGTYCQAANSLTVVLSYAGPCQSIQSGYWDDPITWNNAVPTTSQTATIKSGHTVTIRGNTNVIMDNIIVENGGSVVSENTERLVVSNDLDNTGFIELLKFTGSTRTLNNLGEISDLRVHLNNSGFTLTSNSMTTVRERLRITNGTLNSEVTFKSDANGTAIFDERTSGSGTGTFAGTAAIETYYSSGDAGWRYWACPVGLNNLGEIEFLGSAIYRYEEASAINDYMDGWVSLDNTDAHNINDGYAILLSENQSNSARIVKAKGTLNTGSSTPTTLSINGITIDQNKDPRGWHLISNSYQCNLDWDAIYASNSGTVEPTIYRWDPTSQDYASYNGNTQQKVGSSVSGLIEPHMAFFVKSINSTATFTIDNTHKEYSYGPTSFQKINTNQNVPTLGLSLNSATRQAPIVVRFDGGTGGFDVLLDNRNKIGEGHDLIEFASNSGINELDIQVNTVETLDEDPIVIPLHTKVLQFENLSIQLDNSVSMPANAAVYLYDKQLSVQHDLCQGAYTFIQGVQAADDRFELRVIPNASVNVTVIENNTVELYASNNHIMLELETPLEEATTMQLVNLSGQIIQNILVPAGQTSYAFKCSSLLKNNLYIVSIPAMDISKKIRW
jgi:hypothetical protein